MTYWKIRYDDGSGREGWLIFDIETMFQRLTDEDGNDIIGGISYTTIDVEAAPPEWA
jgi:hypothetical protein